MPFQWSKHAAHIQSVFRSWQAGDGYPPELLATTERALSITLPDMLKLFYCSWGQRFDMTRTCETLLRPDQLYVHKDTLVFAEENQAVFYWGIPCDLIRDEDPAVYYAVRSADDEQLVWEHSHNHVSDFLDFLTYGHALARGAPHGGIVRAYSHEMLTFHMQLPWTAIEIASVPMGVYPNPQERWVLYGQQGVVVDSLAGQLWVATRTRDRLEEVRQQFHITWDDGW
ncbi:MAG: hypothetical protein M3R24_01145 [Chloroflexota bacterium]|nr:hypothetical protein [Chloroflexota bacterium]